MTFEEELASLHLDLLRFAVKLCHNPIFAKDLAQDTMVQALACKHQFKPDTKLKAWAMTILRNRFFTLKRRMWRNADWDPDIGERQEAGDNVEASTMVLEVRAALQQMPDDMVRTILALAGGTKYEDVALAEGVRVGTIKSRAARGRKMLKALINGEVVGRGQRLGHRFGVDGAKAFDELLEKVAA